MFTRKWSISERRYELTLDRDVRIAMPDGVELDGDVYRPASSGRFPVILSISPYDKRMQSPPLRPVGFTPMRGWMEAGDPNFFVRRGYAHAIFTVRGTGDSGGLFQFSGPKDLEDIAALIDTLSTQPWCDGNVAMFGVSFFAKLAKAVAAAHAPPALKAIFSPYSANDWYRDIWYQGGILSGRFLSHWRFSPHRLRYESLVRPETGDDAYRERIEDARRDPELASVPGIAEALQNPDVPTSALFADLVVNPLDGPFWQSRNIDGEPGSIPAYLGADWGNYGLHLPGVFPAWDAWQGPKKLIIGPPVYLDRPLYQYQTEALRWFDHWLLGTETGIAEDPAVRCFVPPLGEWRALEDWPPPEARWTTFFLHADATLSEHEPWPGSGSDTYVTSPFEQGELHYSTPPLVEATELMGPSVLTLYLSTTDSDALLFVTLLAVDRDGTEIELTRGWLRASQRAVDEERSRPWRPVLRHTQREPLTPDDVYELRIPIVETARYLQPGERLVLRIKSCDDEPAATSLEGIARNHITRPGAARVTVHRDENHPSRLELPITRGNIIGTYFSGGDVSVYGLRG